MTLQMTFRQLLMVAAVAASGAAYAQTATHVEVFKSPYCGCCKEWVEHMRKAGFDVTTQNVTDVPAARKATGMPEKFGSCHTAKVGGYAIEGHVPAADVQRLLKEKPKAIGLAVPGMPQGSPGMETNHPQPYDTILVMPDGSYKVFAKH